MFLTACESLYYNQFDVMHSAIANFLFIIMQSTLRPTKGFWHMVELLRSSTPKYLCVRKLFIGKIISLQGNNQAMMKTTLWDR